jgi:hypothetical protein
VLEEVEDGILVCDLIGVVFVIVGGMLDMEVMIRTGICSALVLDESSTFSNCCGLSE